MLSSATTEPVLRVTREAFRRSNTANCESLTVASALQEAFARRALPRSTNDVLVVVRGSLRDSSRAKVKQPRDQRA